MACPSQVEEKPRDIPGSRGLRQATRILGHAFLLSLAAGIEEILQGCNQRLRRFRQLAGAGPHNKVHRCRAPCPGT